MEMERRIVPTEIVYKMPCSSTCIFLARAAGHMVTQSLGHVLEESHAVPESRS